MLARILSTALVALVASPSAMPLAAVGAPTITKPIPIDVSNVAIPLRLRMKVTVLQTGDSSEGPGNTEDEIYFALAGMTRVAGAEKLLIRRTVRPQISRDFWEMGTHSAERFEAIVFEGKLAPNDRAVFGVLLGEQDNAALGALVQAFTLAVTGLVERMIADYAEGAETTSISADDLSGEMTKLANQMMGDGDELMGAVEVGVKGGKLFVKTPANTSSSVAASTNKTARVMLTGGGGKYQLDFTLEPSAEARPTTTTFLSQEKDACSQPNLFVEAKGGGTVNVLKGDGGVPVRVKDDVFHWHCGSMSEDDQTNAPDDTKLVEVTRAASGSDIRWDCYHEATAVPQYSW
ncbi:MAG: hypothetical protein K1X88_09560 [Nannocystaceae bacterium]|nr:hypothetical protein [Nannocystaceae bacterium]